MRVALIFPPVFNPAQPYGSLNILATALKSTVQDVIIWDWNLDFFEYVLSEKKQMKTGHSEEESFNPQIGSDILGTIRGEKFYQPSEYLNAMANLDRCLYQWTSVFGKSAASFWGFNSPYSSSSSDSIYSSTFDKEKNPFIYLYEAYYSAQIEEYKPDLVGFSLVAQDQLIATFTLARLIKTSFPSTYVCIGGPLVTYLQDSIANVAGRFEWIDAFVVGEGCEPLVQIAKHFDSKLHSNRIPNLITKYGRTFASYYSLNTLPQPSHEFISNKLYIAPEIVYPLLVKRGCNYSKCNFCSIPYVSQASNRTVECLSPLKVVQTIEHLYDKKDFRFFFFNGESLLSKEVSQYAEEILLHRLDVYWYYWSRLENLKSNDLEKLFLAGCRKICFGFETASNRLLREMNKGNNIIAAEKLLKACKMTGIAPHLYVMIGYPTEQFDDIKYTLDFLVEKVDIASIYGLTITVTEFDLERHSNIIQSPQSHGIQNIRNQQDFAVSYQYSRQDGISSDDMATRAEWLRKQLATVLHGAQFIGSTNPHHLLYLRYLEMQRGAAKHYDKQ